jgi:heparan-sulfate lyase
MENDVRCGQMSTVFPDMLTSPDFDAKTLLYFLGSFHDQADHIPKVYAAVGNHRLGELSRVFRNALAFPEFKRAAAWKNDALTLLPKMMDDSVYADGMNKELVFSYHTMYIGLFADAYKMFTESGHGHLLPDFYHQRLLKMAEIYAMQTFPDFSICQFGDGWKGRNAGSLFANNKSMGPFAMDFPYAEFMASSGKTGSPPAKTSVAYPESGFYFFRSGWNPDAVFMALKCAQPGEWHNQIDNGTFELYAHGQNLMIDSGCYLYGSSDPEEQKWRAWFRSTKVHQTLTLDNRDADRKPKHLLWTDSADLTALVVENQSYQNLKHRRTVLFVGKKYFIIRDQAIGGDAGDVRIHFQFAPCDFTLNDLDAKSNFPAGANLLVRTFPQGKPVQAEKDEGWISYKINEKSERPAWSWKIDKSADDAQVGFLTALVPFKQGTEPTAIQAKCTDDGHVMKFEIQDGEGNKSITLDLNQGTAVIHTL